MVYTLWLIRHAKSSWDYQKISDLDRPLKQRGYEDANLMGKQLQLLNCQPELLVVSPATRTYQTALIISRYLNSSEVSVQLSSGIYENDENGLLEELKMQDPSHQCLALVGHEPGLSGLVRLLSNKELSNFPTSGVAQLEFEGKSWNDLQAGSCEIKTVLTPKQFKN